ncbi:MAG: T9SS type A sorting domain-containing protein [Bacteroidetes bacterium]|nr:T9SS type A sorting domain-containing protein [Bacteroidota bacterium]
MGALALVMTVDVHAQSSSRSGQRAGRTGVPHPHIPELRGGGAPANDECATAAVLALHTAEECTTLATAGDNGAAVPSSGDPSCDEAGGGYQDVWYAFNSGENGQVLITLTSDAAMTDWAFTVLQGCDGTEVACEITPMEAINVLVDPNTDYVVRVYSNLDWGVGGPFTLCVTGNGMPPPPPANDECAAAGLVAVVLPSDCVTLATAGANGQSTTSTGDPSCDAGTGYQDVWFAVSSGPNEQLTVTLTPDVDMTDWAFVMLDGCDGQEVACEVAPQAPVDVVVTTNTDYVIRVYSNLDWGVGGHFTLCVSGAASTIGIAEHRTPVAFSVYPNPTDGDLTLSYGDATGPVTIDVLDMAGRVVFAQQRTLTQGGNVGLALNGKLSSGVYTLRLSTAHGRSEQRVVVK